MHFYFQTEECLKKLNKRSASRIISRQQATVSIHSELKMQQLPFPNTSYPLSKIKDQTFLITTLPFSYYRPYGFILWVQNNGVCTVHVLDVCFLSSNEMYVHGSYLAFLLISIKLEWNLWKLVVFGAIWKVMKCMMSQWHETSLLHLYVMS